MKIALKHYAVVILLLLLAIGAAVAWHIYFKEYWPSKTLTLYQLNGVLRLCDNNKPLSPTWNATPENKSKLDEASLEAHKGTPITIIGQGGYDIDTSEVHINNITKISYGINPRCELR